MKNIKIIAQTPEGHNALEKHIAESMKLNKKARITQNMLGIKQSVISTNPLILEVSFKNVGVRAVLKPAHVIDEIKEAMRINGAVHDIDYYTEVDL